MYEVDKKSGRVIALAGQGEALMATRAMVDPTVRTITGTTRQITSALNQVAGGVGWGGGARVVPMYPAWQMAPPPQIKASMPRIMAQGGPVPEGAATSKDIANNNTLLTQLIDEQRQTREQMNIWRTRLKADVSLSELDYKRKLREDSRRASGM
jgi:hypothetical protein